MNRRGFVRSVGAALPVFSLPACAPSTAPAGHAGLEPARLRAVAEVVLPRELGDGRRETVVQGFEAWLAAYRPAAERDHGYGTGEITYTGADPAPGWAAQLEALDLEARQRFGTSFVDSEPDFRLSLIRAHLRREGGGLPDPAEARHVAVGLLSWWAGSSEANDLCYGVSIGRETCRPLATAADPPSPRERG